MRFGLPHLVLASAILHLAGAAYFLSGKFAPASSRGTAAPGSPAELVYLGPVSSFTHGQSTQPPSAPPPTARLTPKAVPVTPPNPLQPELRKPNSVSQAATIALAARSTPQLRSLPPEAILSPRHAPQLDGSAGVVFLLDVSGSMYEPYAGSTRLVMARQALTPLITAMPDGTPFAVVLYAEHSRCSGPLVAASDVTRDAAIRFIQRDIDIGGGTNLPDALAWAAELRAGRVVLVTDGDLNSAIPALLARAKEIMGPQGHCPALNIIGIAPRPDEISSYILQSLARQQGGTYQIDDTEEVPHPGNP